MDHEALRIPRAKLPESRILRIVLPALAVTSIACIMKTNYCHKAIVCVLAILCTSGTAFAGASTSALRLRRISGAVSYEHVTSGPSITARSTRPDPKPITSSRMAGASVIGDNVSDPFVVTALPFIGSGSTVVLTDDYDESCPFPLNGAPDAVYRYTPATGQIISIDLCGSSFDTKVYVYENTVTPGSPYACNDDYCGPAYVQSYISSLPVDAGIQYFIVVDGYGTFSGNYTIDIATDEACVWSGCAPGALPEGESCATGTDVTNGGCSTPSENFSQLNFGQPVCGLIWAEYPNRDTDWYRATLPAGAVTKWTARAEFPFSIFVFDLASGCGSLQGLRIDGHPCDELSIELETSVTGDYAFVVTTREQYGGYTCATGPWQYEAGLEFVCECACHGDPAQNPSPNECDGVTNVTDVVTIVNIAFRGASAVHDPLSTCPYDRSDVNCNGVVSVTDVVLMVNVTFRGQPVAEQFCNPCTIQ